MHAFFVEAGSFAEGSKLFGYICSQVLTEVVKCDKAEDVAKIYARQTNCKVVVFQGEKLAEGGMTSSATIQEMRDNECSRLWQTIFVLIPNPEQDFDNYITIWGYRRIEHSVLCESLKEMLVVRQKGSAARIAEQNAHDTHVEARRRRGAAARRHRRQRPPRAY